MPPTDPAALNALYNNYFTKRDLEGLVDLYEPSALLYRSDSDAAQGRDAIRRHLTSLLGLSGELTATQLSCVTSDGVALLRAEWRFEGTDPEGNKVSIGGGSSKVARCGTDGEWRYAIDMPVT